MARVLADGGFTEEALAPLGEAVETALQSLAHLVEEETDDALATGFIESKLVPNGILPPEASTLAGKDGWARRGRSTGSA